MKEARRLRIQARDKRGILYLRNMGDDLVESISIQSRKANECDDKAKANGRMGS